MKDHYMATSTELHTSSNGESQGAYTPQTLNEAHDIIQRLECELQATEDDLSTVEMEIQDKQDAYEALHFAWYMERRKRELFQHGYLAAHQIKQSVGKEEHEEPHPLILLDNDTAGELLQHLSKLDQLHTLSQADGNLDDFMDATEQLDERLETLVMRRPRGHQIIRDARRSSPH